MTKYLSTRPDNITKNALITNQLTNNKKIKPIDRYLFHKYVL